MSAAGVGASAGGGAAGVGGMIVEPPPCDQTCVPKAPVGWQGPMAWAEIPGGGTLPSCPAGFSDPKPTDVHRGLVAPDPTCPCTCGPAEGQVCDTKLTVYLDQNCDSPCASLGTLGCPTVSSTCTGSQGTTSIDTLTISGGSCAAHVTDPTPPTWQHDERVCKSSDLGTCEDINQVCARTPDPPYFSPLCVMRVIPDLQDRPICPAAYPNPIEALYKNYTDQRACSACTCGAPTGGVCAGSIKISGGNDCLSSAGEYVLGGLKCQHFDLGGNNVHPTHIYNQLSANPPGSCSVATKSQGTGTASPSGQVYVVCCQ